MADRRMYSKKITDSDAFVEMSSSAQALYFHLNQGADDDGFNNQIQLAMMKAHSTVDDLKVLICKNFIIRFESGVIVIKHWRMHNVLRKDRYTTTTYQEELKLLHIKSNESYTLKNSGCQMVAKWLPQDSIDKDSIDKDSIDKDSIDNTVGQADKTTKKFIKPTLEEVQSYCKERNNGIDAEHFIDYYESIGWTVGKKTMKDWKACVRTWERNKTNSQKCEPAKSEGLLENMERLLKICGDN